MRNREKTIGVIFFITALSSTDVVASQKLITYEVPKQALYTHHNDDYTVRVREPGGEWQDLYEYNVKVDLDRPENASMVHFDMDGEVEVSIKKNNGAISRVDIRPTQLGIVPVIRDGSVILKLEKPEKISVEFDGDRKRNLHVFSNPIDHAPPKRDDPNVIYFGPGVHALPNGENESFKIQSNKTVYIAGGALVQGKIEVINAENVRIIGSGIIDRPLEGIKIERSKNVTVDGPVFINPKFFTLVCAESHGVRINNIKTFSYTPWSDGIDIFSCTDVEISKVFLRTSDDSVAIYGHRWNYYGDVRDITVRDSVLWADIAHPINIGLHGSDKNPEIIENLIFNNIDILEHDEDDRNYQGTMAITCGDNNFVKNVLFKDIRVESVEEGMLFNIRTVFNEKYSHAPGRGVENVRFENIAAKAIDLNRSIISGYSTERAVKGVSFKNVSVNGKKLKREDIEIGEFVSDVSFSN